jgi:hypothetical protein
MSTPQEPLPEQTVTAQRPTQFPISTARQPRGVVKINNRQVRGWESWSVTNNAYNDADTFRVVYSLSALLEPFTPAWFSNLDSDTFVEIFGGFPYDANSVDVNELTSFIYGRIDDIEFDLVAQTMTLTGRDLTGAFIDKKIATQYTNQKASAIVESLATEHNVSYDITPTSQNVGNFYQQDFMELHNGSEWDLLTKLARGAGFVVYMKGQILYFGPDKTGTGSSLWVNYQQPGNRGGPPTAPVIDLTFSRGLTVVKGITVTVQAAGSYNTKASRQSYPTAPRAISPGKSSPYGALTNYYFNMQAGTTPDRLLLRAQTLYNEIISHAMKCRIRMPADETTNVQSTVQTTGTGYSFDQVYFPLSVTRTMSFDGGFVMDIEGQNASPNLTPADPSVSPANATPIVGTATDEPPAADDPPDSDSP